MCFEQGSEGAGGLACGSNKHIQVTDSAKNILDLEAILIHSNLHIPQLHGAPYVMIILIKRSNYQVVTAAPKAA